MSALNLIVTSKLFDMRHRMHDKHPFPEKFVFQRLETGAKQSQAAGSLEIEEVH